MAKKPAEKKSDKKSKKSQKTTEESSKKSKKSNKVETADEEEEGVDEESDKKSKKGKKAKKDKKSDDEKRKEGLTKATEADGIIRFKEGSGSQDVLNLIAKYGYDRAKVIAAGEKLKEKGKAFLKCDPAKKYTKIATIVKNLESNGFKLPPAPEASAEKKAKKDKKAKKSKKADIDD